MGPHACMALAHAAEACPRMHGVNAAARVLGLLADPCGGAWHCVKQCRQRSAGEGAYARLTVHGRMNAGCSQAVLVAFQLVMVASHEWHSQPEAHALCVTLVWTMRGL